MAVLLYFSIGVLSLVLLWLFDYVKNIQFYKHAAKMHGPKGLPFVGNALRFFGKDSTAAHDEVFNIVERYASPCRVWMGNQLFVGIYEPDQLRTILTSPKSMEKGFMYQFGRPLLGNSLLLAPVSIWRAHRKLIQPAFNPQTLRTFVHIFDKHSKSMVEKMEKELDGGEFKIQAYLLSLSLNVTLEATMGISETSDSKMYKRYAECLNSAFESVMVRVYRLWLYPDIIFNSTKYSKDFHQCVSWMHKTVHSIITKKKNKLEETAEDQNGETANEKKGFLDILLDLQDKQKLSEQEVCDETNLMVGAAYDTASVTLEYLMLLLASYPDVQEKVYQELKHIYSEVIPENICVTSEDLKEMKYTERVIQESMRVLPTVGFITRKVEQDLEIGGYTVPKGTTALCFIEKVHRDEKYWPDPLKFDPDRFLPEEVAKRNPNCYMPFSSGPRNCIGSTYAMMEMKTVVARVVLKYILKKEHIQPIINIKQKLELISHPAEPVTIEIVERLTKISKGKILQS